MPRIIVCPLSHVPTSVSTHQASHLVTLIKDGTRVERPRSIAAERHLFLTFDDIVEPVEGMTPPAKEHAEALLSFVDRWAIGSVRDIHGDADVGVNSKGTSFRSP